MTKQEPAKKEKEFELLTRRGHPLDEAMSCYQKAIRRGELIKAVYWGFELEERFYKVFWERSVTISTEDVFNIDVVNYVCNLRNFYLDYRKEKKRRPDPVIVTSAIMVLVKADKNRDADELYNYYDICFNKGGEILEPDDYCLDKHCARGKAMGRGISHFFENSSLLNNDVGEHKYLEFIKNYYLKNNQ